MVIFHSYVSLPEGNRKLHTLLMLRFWSCTSTCCNAVFNIGPLRGISLRTWCFRMFSSSPWYVGRMTHVIKHYIEYIVYCYLMSLGWSSVRENCWTPLYFDGKKKSFRFRLSVKPNYWSGFLWHSDAMASKAALGQQDLPQPVLARSLLECASHLARGE